MAKALVEARPHPGSGRVVDRRLGRLAAGERARGQRAGSGAPSSPMPREVKFDVLGVPVGPVVSRADAARAMAEGARRGAGCRRRPVDDRGGRPRPAGGPAPRHRVRRPGPARARDGVVRRSTSPATAPGSVSTRPSPPSTCCVARSSGHSTERWRIRCQPVPPIGPVAAGRPTPLVLGGFGRRGRVIAFAAGAAGMARASPRCRRGPVRPRCCRGPA